ncbi:hypothetical protein [Agrobacterium sp. lyk4-40-TYG-31]|uniref:hypothetical protein n=1 Tax=Agrobacterium sp. lyk4-40-TYG-31 TaxID=3040276 RepID=UPI00254E60F9|nr:hypothetical protein [Agrobacterium sp. lyk4-40-TYG-31]
MKSLHRLISLTITLAVLTAIYFTSGEIRLEFIVLGAAMGGAYWYWGPTGAPL